MFTDSKLILLNQSYPSNEGLKFVGRCWVLHVNCKENVITMTAKSQAKICLRLTITHPMYQQKMEYELCMPLHLQRNKRKKT